MSTPRSLDLRVRVLSAVASGLSHRQAGERFGVSAASGLPPEKWSSPEVWL
jgi:transposase